MATILQNIGKEILGPVLNVTCRTVKTKNINYEEYQNYRKSGKKFVLVFWHGTMLQVWFNERPNKNEKIATFASKSPDGELAVRSLIKWGYDVVRGSSREGADDVKKIISQKIENGSSLFVVPDGPVGPNKKMKFGALKFAQKYSLPIFLVAVSFKNKKIFNSWDKFEFPHLFTRAFMVFSNAIFIDKNEVDLNDKKNEVENIFAQLQLKADGLAN